MFKSNGVAVFQIVRGERVTVVTLNARITALHVVTAFSKWCAITRQAIHAADDGAVRTLLSFTEK